MLKLGTPEAGWQEMAPGARVRFAPITIKAVRAARRAVAAALKVDVEDLEEAGDELSRELIRRGIVELDGFGDADGNPLEATPDGIALFIGTASAFEWADRVYVKPWAEREREKNDYAGSPNGTSTEVTPAPDTASSAAAPAQVIDAGLIRKPAKARSARTSSTSPKRTRPKKSGK